MFSSCKLTPTSTLKDAQIGQSASSNCHSCVGELQRDAGTLTWKSPQSCLRRHGPLDKGSEMSPETKTDIFTIRFDNKSVQHWTSPLTQRLHREGWWWHHRALGTFLSRRSWKAWKGRGWWTSPGPGGPDTHTHTHTHGHTHMHTALRCSPEGAEDLYQHLLYIKDFHSLTLVCKTVSLWHEGGCFSFLNKESKFYQPQGIKQKRETL